MSLFSLFTVRCSLFPAHWEVFCQLFILKGVLMITSFFVGQVVKIDQVKLSYRGKDSTAMLQLAKLPWARQLELLSDNGTCDLPGFEEGAVPSENLMWILCGFDAECQHFPASQHFNGEETHALKTCVYLCVSVLHSMPCFLAASCMPGQAILWPFSMRDGQEVQCLPAEHAGKAMDQWAAAHGHSEPLIFLLVHCVIVYCFSVQCFALSLSDC